MSQRLNGQQIERRFRAIATFHRQRNAEGLGDVAKRVRGLDGAGGRRLGSGSASPRDARRDAQSRAGSRPLPRRACGPGDGLVTSAGGQCVSPLPFHSLVFGPWRDDEALATFLHLSAGTARRGEGWTGRPTQAPAGRQRSDEELGSPGHPDPETPQWLPARHGAGTLGNPTVPPREITFCESKRPAWDTPGRKKPPKRVRGGGQGRQDGGDSSWGRPELGASAAPAGVASRGDGPGLSARCRRGVLATSSVQ